MSRVGLVGLLALVGCGMAAEKDAAPRAAEDCPSNASTEVFAAGPNSVTRGEPVDVWVSWTVSLPLAEPVVATLRAGDGPVVEVELPLSYRVGTNPYDYEGAVLNPFGAGAPGGTLEVLVEAARDPECSVTPTAATALTLE